MDYKQPDLFSFHNSVNLSGEELSTNEAKAKSLEVQILGIFETYPGRAWAAHEMQGENFQGKLLTSIRRAFCNLMNAGKLEKLGEDFMIDGPYGVRVHRYKLIY